MSNDLSKIVTLSQLRNFVARIKTKMQILKTIKPHIIDAPSPILNTKTITAYIGETINETLTGVNITKGSNGITSVKWEATNLPNGITFDNGNFSGAGTEVFNGTSIITITTNGGTIDTNVIWNIIEVPAPTLNGKTLNKDVGDTINETISGTNITVGTNGVTSVSWSATNLPTGVSFSNGKFTGSPTAAFSGTSVVTVTTNGGTASANIIWNVVKPVPVPSLTAKSISKYVGDTINETMSGSNITKGSNGVTSVSWSATNLPSGVSFSDGKFTGSPTAAFSGKTTVKVTTNGGTASAYVTWDITKKMSKPSFTSTRVTVDFPKTTSTGQTVKTVNLSGTFDGTCTFTFSPSSFNDRMSYATYSMKTPTYTETNLKFYVEQNVKKKPSSNGTEDYKTVTVTAKNSMGSASFSFEVHYRMPWT